MQKEKRKKNSYPATGKKTNHGIFIQQYKQGAKVSYIDMDKSKKYKVEWGKKRNERTQVA